ncbi:MAG: glycosyltransferase family 4 protein [Cytophagales bacterium]|nr:glycosyltransferase family 4 protein [Bernardetiaceae bacterium]MDW8210093.1 glycosyltransferase family 4 protein [Cytophagales bacterium]
MQEVVKGLVQAGHEVIVLTALPHYPKGKIMPAYRGKWFVREIFKGYQVWRCALLPSASTKVLPRLISVLSLMISMLWHWNRIAEWAPQWVMVQSPPLPLALLGWWLARQLHARLLLNVSDLWPDALAHMGVISPSSWLFRYAKKVELFLYQQADLLMAQSEESVDYLQHCVSSCKPVLLYRVGILPEAYPPCKQMRHYRRRLIYFGLIGMAQGLEAICRHVPFAKLGVELHIYGDGPMRPSLDKWLKHSPNKHFCFLHPSVPFQQIPMLLADFDGALIAQQQHLYGTVPSKLYEAMAAGLPVVFSGAGEAAEIVRKAHCGWVASAGNWQALTEAIAHFAQASTDYLEGLGAAGRAYAAVHFHLDLQNKVLLEALQPSRVSVISSVGNYSN